MIRNQITYKGSVMGEIKKIWEFNCCKYNHITTVWEEEEGILTLQPEGNLSLLFMKEFLSFMKIYTRETGKKVQLAVNSYKINKIDPDARNYLITQSRETSPVNKGVSFGCNHSSRNLLNLFFMILTGKEFCCRHYATREESICELKSAS